MRLLLPLLALGISLASAYTISSFCVGGTETAWSVAASDQIDVWYVEAPVFESEYGTNRSSSCRRHLLMSRLLQAI